jgi:DNA-binding MarR family transcriptional regulator
MKTVSVMFLIAASSELVKVLNHLYVPSSLPDHPALEPAEPEPRLLLLGRMRAVERAVHRQILAVLVANGYPDIRIPHITFLAHMTTEGRRLTEFAELMQVTKSAASQVASALEAQGLVERAPDPRDRRAALIRATPAADAGFRLARARIAQIEREWTLLLGEPAMTELARTLRRLEGWAESAGDLGSRRTKLVKDRAG